MLLWSRFLGLGDSVLSLAGAMVSKDVFVVPANPVAKAASLRQKRIFSQVCASNTVILVAEIQNLTHAIFEPYSQGVPSDQVAAMGVIEAFRSAGGGYGSR